MITNIQTLMLVPFLEVWTTLCWMSPEDCGEEIFSFNGLGLNLGLCACKARTFPLSHIPCLSFVFSY